MNTTIGLSVNFHLTEACNMSCKFCFATFADIHAKRGKDEQNANIVRALAVAGFTKITFAGGEPTLLHQLPELLSLAKSLNMTTMVVTNGYRILDEERFNRIAESTDWFILSIDSVNPVINALSGRSTKNGKTISLDDYHDLCNRIKSSGKKLKINTVVSRFNVEDNLVDFISQVQPDRWKIFQALPVAGQNDKHDFEISEEEYNAYLIRNSRAELSTVIVPENNDAMTGSYHMVAPNGCFFDNSKGYHTYSRHILSVGVQAALQAISFDYSKYLQRGGVYNWDL